MPDYQHVASRVESTNKQNCMRACSGMFKFIYSSRNATKLQPVEQYSWRHTRRATHNYRFATKCKKECGVNKQKSQKFAERYTRVLIPAAVAPCLRCYATEPQLAISIHDRF